MKNKFNDKTGILYYVLSIPGFEAGSDEPIQFFIGKSNWVFVAVERIDTAIKFSQGIYAKQWWEKNKDKFLENEQLTGRNLMFDIEQVRVRKVILE